MKEQEQQRLFKEMSHYKSRCIDLMCEIDELEKKRAYWEMRCKEEQEKIKQALSQRNQEILKIIDKLKMKHTKEHDGCGDPSECCFNRLDVLDWDFFDELKQQLTNSEGKDV